MGGSKTYNLFQFPDLIEHLPDLIEHLDEMTEVGANYIRCTMHGRLAAGYELLPFVTLEDGKRDLDQWNPEYWSRFARMLQETKKRDIPVQIELFDEHVHASREQWDNRSAWNLDNNVNYTCTIPGSSRFSKPRRIRRPRTPPQHTGKTCSSCATISAVTLAPSITRRPMEASSGHRWTRPYAMAIRDSLGPGKRYVIHVDASRTLARV